SIWLYHGYRPYSIAIRLALDTAGSVSTERVRRIDVSDRRPIVARGVRTNAASRQLVGTTAGCVSRFVGVHRLLHVGCSAGAAFQVRTISLTILFARIVWPRT